MPLQDKQENPIEMRTCSITHNNITIKVPISVCVEYLKRRFQLEEIPLGVLLPTGVEYPFSEGDRTVLSNMDTVLIVANPIPPGNNTCIISLACNQIDNNFVSWNIDRFPFDNQNFSK